MSQTCHEYRYYVHTAKALRDADYDLSTLPDYSNSHLLIEMSRLSEFGLRGDSFRHWVCGLFKDGVFVYTDNYKLGVAILEAPNIAVRPGCQDSCAHGDPWPKPASGTWLRNDRDIPDSARKAISEITRDVLMDGVTRVLAKAESLRREHERQMARDTERTNRIKSAWRGDRP